MEVNGKPEKILNKRPSLKSELDNSKPSKKKNVIWDENEIKEQELEKILYPKMKILEPKTPYTGTVISLIYKKY